MDKDHEFPWIEFDMQTREMICARCKREGSTDYWLAFLVTHQKCEPTETQEITKNDIGNLEDIFGDTFL